MVDIGITDLGHEEGGLAGRIEHIALEQVVGAPFHGRQQFITLTGSGVAPGKLQSSPGEVGEAGSQGQAKLAIITGIVIAAAEIQLQSRLEIGAGVVAEINSIKSITEA